MAHILEGQDLQFTVRLSAFIFLRKKKEESSGESETVYALSFVYNIVHWEEKLILVHFLIRVLFAYRQFSGLRPIPSTFM